MTKQLEMTLTDGRRPYNVGKKPAEAARKVAARPHLAADAATA
jgi:hypothetical protein